MRAVEDSEVRKQLKTLEDFIKSNPKSAEMKRALAAKLALEGYRYEKIKEILAVSVGFISKWFNAFKVGGNEALKSRYKGTESYLSPEERAETIAWLIQQKAWDISELETYLIDKYDVVFQSRQSYYQIFQEAKISWQKGEQVNPRYDAELTKKKTKKLPHFSKNIAPK
ncbi:helix-turn-helix domain-containing protein [Floridanema evergladense]|uniref:Transposase n=1 Tax=Floridaenema evergladense BLCC-F167 TaxID=3153639 RepID=A0ABV4WL18_9CYAN